MIANRKRILMKKTNYHLLLIATIFSICGCSVASPLDIITPARNPSSVTIDYMGHLYPTNHANGMYFSTVDAKVVKAMLPLRQMELKTAYYVAKGEIDLIEQSSSALSNGLWAGLSAVLIGAGVMVPRPQEKAKVVQALHTPPPPR